jgi:PAS domain-containing protein
VQKPLEQILARNLVSSLSTPAFLTDEDGALIYYNEAAGELLNKGFDEIDGVGADVWDQIGPFDRRGERVPLDDLPLALAMRDGCPAHAGLRIRSFTGVEHDVEVSALPILTGQGARGVLAFLWSDPRGAD